jgi:hypothetical protein
MLRLAPQEKKQNLPQTDAVRYLSQPDTEWYLLLNLKILIKTIANIANSE